MTHKKFTDELDLNQKGLLNRAKGAAEEAKGRARNALGVLTGDGASSSKAWVRSSKASRRRGWAKCSGSSTT